MVIEPLVTSSATFDGHGAIRTVDDVVRLVRSWIEKARLRPGDKLPTERALAEQFELNRNLVRRAFQRLDDLGVIHRHVGRGTFVGPRVADEAGMPARSSGAQAAAGRPVELEYSPATILQARGAFEPRIAALAVANATASDLRRLDGLVEALRLARTETRQEEIDIAFHDALAQATHNDLIRRMSEIISDARRAATIAPDEAIALDPDEAARVAASFAALARAVRMRDPVAAAAAHRTVLARASRTFALLARMELLPETD